MNFDEAVQGLLRGDFSRLEPLFDGANSSIVQWCEEGRFREHPAALKEALTCACFLGKLPVAEYLLKQGVDVSGGNGTGLNALHWASNRGQIETVRLLLRHGAPLETRNMYGGTVLGAAVWAAVHEAKPGHATIIQDLIDAGARIEDSEYPSGDPRVDAILMRGRQG